MLQWFKTDIPTQTMREYTSGIVPPSASGGEHLMSAGSLKLELRYLSEEYQQALDPGWKYMQALGWNNICIFREQVCIKRNG